MARFDLDPSCCSMAIHKQPLGLWIIFPEPALLARDLGGWGANQAHISRLSESLTVAKK